ncbi:MAG TPA: nitrogen fixation protein NifQ [Polyangiales bacterium]
MTVVEVYGFLVAGAERASCDAFDTHVVASIVSLGLLQSQQDASPTRSLGLSAAELVELAELVFPHAAHLFAGLAPELPLSPSEDQRRLHELLFMGSNQGSRFEFLLAGLIARRAKEPNHLWQDLGLRHRRELSWLMSRHFEAIAARNTQDMKWKKFLYRLICCDEAFALCVAPSCAECDDRARCFGEEDGESLVPTAPTA